MSNEAKFHKFSNKPIKGKRLNSAQVESRTENGTAILFDLDTDIGGFRFIHGVSRRLEQSYMIIYFPKYGDAPYGATYELSLFDFHLYVSYYLIEQNMKVLKKTMPEGRPSPIENLRWCMKEMVKNSE